jgi:hypothetical protein
MDLRRVRKKVLRVIFLDAALSWSPFSRRPGGRCRRGGEEIDLEDITVNDFSIEESMCLVLARLTHLRTQTMMLLPGMVGNVGNTGLSSHGKS